MTFRALIAVIAVIALETSAPTNLLQNGGFDRDLSGWTGYGLNGAAWLAAADGRSAAVKVINEGLIRTPMTSGKDVLVDSIAQCVAVQPGKLYALSARGRVPADQHIGGYGAISVVWFETANCSIRSNGSGIIGFPTAKLTEADGIWHDLSMPALVAPSGARAAQITLDAAVTDFEHRVDFEVWFDDAVFTQTDLPSAAVRVARLFKAIHDNDYVASDEVRVLEAAVIEGPVIVPFLESVLWQGRGVQPSVASAALARIGGESAIAALERQQQRRPGDSASIWLAYALASRGNAADREWLMRAVADTQNSSGVRDAATLSLGVLRDADATPALERPVTLGAIDPRDADVIAAVLQQGIPDRGANVFADRSRHGTWRRRDGQWTFDRSTQSGSHPAMTLPVIQSPDGSRALVEASFSFSVEDQFGYDYILRKSSGRWEVQAVIPRWVAGRLCGCR